MIEELNKLKISGVEQISAVTDLKVLGEIKGAIFGKTGSLNSISKGMRDLSAEDRPKVGVLMSEVRKTLEDAFERKEAELKKQELARKLEEERVDITEPAKGEELGALHPISVVVDRLCDICVDLGFSVVEGPEIESDYYNFEAMNIPKNHPSRDMQDTFFISENVLLRSQTSAVQAREMEKRKPPFKIVCPGKTYRNESDSTHSPIFHQFEGLVVDENVSMADLKSMLTTIMRRLYGDDTVIRFRPSFFPFTEPSVEVDVSCHICNGKGCPTCKGTGWIEILGAGEVHPNVLKMAGYDPEKCSGFAFGVGIERVAMLKYGIDDIRHFYTNDKRFNSTFKRYE